VVKLFTSPCKVLGKARDRGLAKYLWVRAWVGDFFTRKQAGASLTEYALLLALIAVVCISAIAFLGNSVSSFLSKLGDKIKGVPLE